MKQDQMRLSQLRQELFQIQGKIKKNLEVSHSITTRPSIEVEIEIERITPAELVVRKGRKTSYPPTQPQRAAPAWRDS